MSEKIKKKNLKMSGKISVINRWLLSYIFMLLLVVVASIGLFFYAYKIISAQQDKVNGIMLEKLQMDVDDYFNSTKSTAMSLLLDPNVKMVIKKQEFAEEDKALLSNVYETLRNEMEVSDCVENIFLYFMYGDTVLSTEGHMDKTLFYELYYKNREVSEEDFRNIMESRWDGSIVSLKNSKNEEELIFLKNVNVEGNNDLCVTIGVSISKEKAIQWIEEIKWNESTEVIILDSEKVLCSNGQIYESLLEEYSLQTMLNKKTTEIRIKGVHYYIASIDSPYSDLNYIAISPQKDVYQGARKIQYFMVSLLMACLSLGTIVAYKLTRGNNTILKEVMEAFGYYDDKYDHNDYAWILEQKEKFYKEHEKAKLELNERESILRRQDLYRLISLPYDKRYQNYKDLSKDKLFEKEKILVFLCYIYSLDHESIYTNVNRNLSAFIFANMLDEIVAGRLTIEVVDMTDCYACIVNTDKEENECREILEEVLDQAQTFWLENVKLQTLFAFGNVQHGIDGVHTSYIQAREAAEYRDSTPGTQFVWIEDIKNRQELYQYTVEKEQKIINAICVGNSEDVCRWIEEIIEFNYHKRELTYQMKKCLAADLLGTIIKGAEQSGHTQYIIDYMDENQNPESWPKSWPEFWEEDRLVEYMHGIVEGLCANIRENETKKKEDKNFGWQVIAFVKENYQNPDLNISITALHFNITPSYLSTLFREQTGLNLLEYINHIRVEEAKRLLEEGCSLAEVCDRAGFRSSGALIRVFKKETGVTPGQMKKILGQTNKE